MKGSLESRIARLEVERMPTRGFAERWSDARLRWRGLSEEQRQEERDARIHWALTSPPPARGLALALWKAVRRLAKLDSRRQPSATNEPKQ